MSYIERFICLSVAVAVLSAIAVMFILGAALIITGV